MKALVVESPRNAVYKELPVPVPRGDDVLMKVRVAGICGTDQAIYTGDCSFVRDGSIVYPVRFGHEWSGVVEAVGEAVTDLKKGDHVITDNGVSCGVCEDCKAGNYADCQHSRAVGTVNCWDGCFAEYMLMPRRHVYKLAEHVSFEHAALIEPASISYEGFRHVTLDQRSTVAVIGTGPIGMSAVALARYFGAGQVVCVGRRDNKLEVARRMGATHTVNNTKEDAVAAIRALTGGRGADLILETSGAQEGLVQAILAVRKAGLISVVGFYEKDLDGIPMDHLVLNEITLRGTAGRMGNAEAVKNILEAGGMDLTPMITHRVAFDKCLEFFEHEDRYHADKIKALVLFDA